MPKSNKSVNMYPNPKKSTKYKIKRTKNEIDPLVYNIFYKFISKT